MTINLFLIGHKQSNAVRFYGWLFYIFEKASPSQAEFLPAFIKPKEQRITSFS